MSTGPGFCLVSSINSKNGELDMELGMRAISLNWEPFSNLSPWGSAFSLEASSFRTLFVSCTCQLLLHNQGHSHTAVRKRVPTKFVQEIKERDLEGQGLCHGQWPVVMMDHHVRFEVGRGNEHEPLKRIAILQLGICMYSVNY